MSSKKMLKFLFWKIDLSGALVTKQLMVTDVSLGLWIIIGFGVYTVLIVFILYVN